MYQQTNMKQLSILLLLVTFRLVTFGQVYQEMPQYGYRANRMAFDSTLQIPTFCGVPTLKSVVKANKNGAIAYDSCNARFYAYNPKTLTWTAITGGGGGTTPNLQQVTTAGATTTNSISVNSLNLTNASNPITLNGNADQSFAVVRTGTSDELFSVNDGVNGYLKFGGGGVGQYVKINTNGNANVELTAPSTNGTIPISVNGYTANTAGEITISTIDTTNKFVNRLERTPGKDSIIYFVGANRFAIKDSVGGGSGNDTSKVVIAQVHNATATTLLKGEVVYLFSSNGNVASVKRANNKQDSTSSKTLGLVRRDIPAGGTGFVTTQGQIEKLNLGSYVEGDVIWLDSLDGQFTKVKPQAPYHGVFLGVVERANNGNGLAYIKPQNGVELDEVHDVQINNILNNQIIVYSDTQKVWKNSSIYSVVDTTSTIATKTNLNSYVNLTTAQTIGGQKTFTSNIKIPNSGSQLILQVNSDQSVNGMSTAIYPSPSELAHVKGVTSAIQTQINNKVNISDTASMLSPYAKSNLVATKLNASDTISLSTRIETKLTNLDLLQSLSYGIKAEPYGCSFANVTSTIPMTSTGMYFYPFNWNVSDTIRGVAFFNRVLAVAVTASNYNGIAIYSLSGSTLTRQVSTTNSGTFWDGSANTWKSQSFTPTFLAKGTYYIGYQASATSGLPTIASGTAMQTGLSEPPVAVNSNSIKLSFLIANNTTSAPTSVAMGSTTTSQRLPYFILY